MIASSAAGWGQWLAAGLVLLVVLGRIIRNLYDRPTGGQTNRERPVDEVES
jgi:hypothetical protein